MLHRKSQPQTQTAHNSRNKLDGTVVVTTGRINIKQTMEGRKTFKQNQEDRPNIELAPNQINKFVKVRVKNETLVCASVW